MLYTNLFRISLLLLIAFLLGTPAHAQQKDAQDSLMQETVEILPNFKSGEKGWRNFIVSTMKLNKVLDGLDSVSYVKYGFKQNALVEFTVCEDGVICDVEVVNKKNVMPEYAEEVLRVMAKSPKWRPAMKNGTPIQVRYRQTISTNLEDFIR